MLTLLNTLYTTIAMIKTQEATTYKRRDMIHSDVHYCFGLNTVKDSLT